MLYLEQTWQFAVPRKLTYQELSYLTNTHDLVVDERTKGLCILTSYFFDEEYARRTFEEMEDFFNRL